MTVVYVGERCPGCHVVCASLDVEHLDGCRYQGRGALELRDGPLPIIGRERARVDKLAKRLLDTVQRHYDWTPSVATERGRRFDVKLDIDTGDFVARVTVELLPPQADA